MDENSGWCTIESDPGVFTELIQRIGVKNVEVEEVVSLDDDTLKGLPIIYGLIFLFKWRKDAAPRQAILDAPSDLFFAKQIVQNACATQAILSVLLNTCEEVDIGDVLRDFRSFTSALDDECKGYAIGNSEVIRTAHNSFRPSTSLEIEQRDDSKGDAFHYVSYVWFRGCVYELDGLQNGPVLVCECSKEAWVVSVIPHIQSRISEYTSCGDNEIRFNLLALTKDKEVELRDSLKSNSLTDSEFIENENKLNEILIKKEKVKIENNRRRFDFTSLSLMALQCLAEKGQLVKLYNKIQASSNE